MAGSGNALSAEAFEAAVLVHEHSNDEVLPEWLARKLGIERWQAVKLLQELANYGYGTFVVGRRGGKTRLAKAEPLPPLTEHPAAQITRNEPSLDETYQVFLLRRNPPVQVRVPIDLTQDEAERLGKWLILVSNQGDQHLGSAQ